MSASRLSLVVPTRDTRALTLRCLESAAPLIAEGAEVVVVDDGSRDGTTEAVRALPGGPLHAPVGALPAFTPAFALVEGWRGRIVHWLMTDARGSLERVKVLDPSFLNWRPLSYALLKNIVPDFPLCNKSFNQSYSGNDL